MASALADVQALSQLLASAQEGDVDRSTHRASAPAAVTPADLFPSAPGPAPSSAPAAKPASKDIWDVDEVPTREEDTAVFEEDGRKRPEYEVIQKQSVTAEDMFLGASEKDPSSAHCDQVVVKVHLPGEVSADLDLDVTRQRIVVQGKHHKLATYLPYPVRHKQGSAKWVADKATLVVTLPAIKPDPLTGELPVLEDA